MAEPVRVLGRLLAVVLCGLALGCAWAQEGDAVTPAPTHLLVVDKSAGQLVGIELASGAVAWRVDVGAGPHEVLAVTGAASPTGGPLALVSRYGTRGSPGSAVVVVDLEALAVTGELSTRPATMPHGLALVPGTSTVLVTVEADDALLALDLADGSTTAYGTGQRLPHMVVAAPDASAAFAANILGGSVTRLALPDGEVTTARVGAGAEGIAMTPGGEELWVGSNEEHEVHVLDPHDLAQLDVFPTCAVPIRVTPVDSTTMAVTCFRGDEVRLYDAVSHEQKGSLALPAASFPVGTIATPDGARLFVAATASGVVYEFDVASLSLLRTLDAGVEPDGMALVALPGSR